MIELLKLCGYEDQEIDSELPRVQKAFDKLGFDIDDIETARQRFVKYYDSDLKGVRKVFRLCMREFVNSMLVKDETDKKIIYGFMCPGIDLIGSAIAAHSRDIFSVYHCWAFHIIVGCIFGKIVPIIEEAERAWLKSGIVAHCANIKTLVGPISLGLFPKPDLLVTCGFTCETSPKTIDLLHELYGIPIFIVDTCQDRSAYEFPAPAMRIAESVSKSMGRLVERIYEITGFKITDDMIRDMQEAKGRMINALNKVREVVRDSDPLALNPSHENIWMCLNSLSLDTKGFDDAVEALDILHQELQERVARGEGVVEKGAPRIMAILPAGQTDPRLEQLACEVGIAIVSIDMSLAVPFQATSEDPFFILGQESQQHSLGLPMKGRVSLIVDGCKKQNIEGVLDRFHAGCRTVVADALIIEKAIKRELGIPVMVLEWENFDPRVYNHEEYKRRLEVFKSMIQKSA